MSDAKLKTAFHAFASYGTRQEMHDMTSKNWVKCLKDAKIIGGGFTATDADLIFFKVKDKTQKTINFLQFCTGLEHVADKKNLDVTDIQSKVEGAQPSTNATQAAYTKFHDDKTTYTGVYAHGGPTNLDKFKAGPGGVLANLLDRSPANVRGVKM